MNLRHLMLPTSHTHGNQMLERYCSWAGIEVHRVNDAEQWSIPDHIYLENATVHDGPGFTRTIARRLGSRLLEPPDDWLVHVPYELIQRDIMLCTLGEATSRTEPRFIKPVNDKYFPARVYTSKEPIAIQEDLRGTAVLSAEPVEWEVEFRAYVLHGQVQTLSAYRGEGSLEAALEFCVEALKQVGNHLPRAVVLDVGVIRNRGWAIVEANAANMCSPYNCEPEKVLKVLAHGIIPI